MPDLEISKLPALSGVNLQPTDPVALADLSASETKQITAKDLIQHGIALIDAGSIPASKLASAGLPDGSVTEPKLAADAVSARALADNSTAVVGAALPAGGSYIGQLAYNSTSDKLYLWNGAAWSALKAAGSVNTITGDTVGPVLLSAAATGDSVTLDAKLSDSLAAGQFLAGPAGAAGPVALRKIDALDLPLATTTDRGAVIVNGGGLKVTAGAISIDNTVAAGVTYGVVTYDAHGLVTAGRALLGSDLPLATSTAVGAIQPGGEFTVSSSGVLSHTNRITAGTGTRVDYDAYGHITGSSLLRDADIPALDAAKITSGTLPTARLANQSVTAAKLADYALAYIQESVPPAGVGAHPIGMTWLQESTGQVSVWNGNSWMKTGASTLFNKNLRYCGTFDATAGKLTGVTQFGTAEGFAVGDLIPAADDKHAGCYFVASGGGTSSSIASGATFDPGDWLLCQGATGGWVRIDTLSGAGGGSGGGSSVSNLDDLLDVTLTSPRAGDGLQFTASGQWVNVRHFGQGATAPVSPTGGSLWLDTTIPATPVLRIYDGTNWLAVGGSGGVASGATAPASPSRGDTWVNTSGTGTPVLSMWDGSKWVALATLDSPTFTGVPAGPTAAAGTDTTQLATTAFVQAAQLLSKTGTTLSAKTAGDLLAPGVLPAATAAAQGAVRLADAAAITAGTAGRVVDAAQLLAASYLTRTGTTLGATTAGDLLAPALMPAATAAAQGAVQLATSAEAATGTDTAKAVTPKALNDGYLAKNIALLPALP